MDAIDTQANCPSDEHLLAFVEGRLMASELAGLVAHLDACVMCRQLVEAALDTPYASPTQGGTATVPLAQACASLHLQAVPGSAAPHGIPSARRPFGPGDLVGARYRLVEFLGAGGMGDVFAAEDTVVGGRVALKTLTGEVANDPEALARLKQEVRLARMITHRNVCRVHDLGFHQAKDRSHPGPIAFLTMELVEGESLGQRIRRMGPIPTAEAAILVDQMISGLQAAHGAGVTHRDFKSDNVLIARDAAGVRVAVTDFGLAYCASSSRSERLTMSSRVVIGTAAYLAPEQLDGGPVSAPADYYGLGVVIFEMLTGALPFSGPTPIATAAKRLVQSPPPLRRYVPEVDPRWETIVAGCMRRDPRTRMAFVSRGLLPTLQHLLSVNEAGRRRRPGKVGSRRKRTLVVAMASGLALGGGLFTVRAVTNRAYSPPGAHEGVAARLESAGSPGVMVPVPLTPPGLPASPGAGASSSPVAMQPSSRRPPQLRARRAHGPASPVTVSEPGLPAPAPPTSSLSPPTSRLDDDDALDAFATRQ